MSFKDRVNADLPVFFNTNEFAEMATVDGVEQTVMTDDNRLKERTAKEYGGISTGMILYFIPVSSFSRKPKPGDSQQFNNRLYWIEDVSETSGVYEIVLNQNRGE